MHTKHKKKKWLDLQSLGDFIFTREYNVWKKKWFVLVCPTLSDVRSTQIYKSIIASSIKVIIMKLSEDVWDQISWTY